MRLIRLVIISLAVALLISACSQAHPLMVCVPMIETSTRTPVMVCKAVEEAK